MVRKKVFPEFFAAISPARIQSPRIGTLFLDRLAVIGLAVGGRAPSVKTFLVNSVSQVGHGVRVGSAGTASTSLRIWCSQYWSGDSISPFRVPRRGWKWAFAHVR